MSNLPVENNKKNGSKKMIIGVVAFTVGIFIKLGFLQITGPIVFLYGLFQYIEKGNIKESKVHNRIMLRLSLVLLFAGLVLVCAMMIGMSNWW